MKGICCGPICRKSIIHSLEAKYSSGYDGITITILKVCTSLISHPLTQICNHLLFTRIFPDRLEDFSSKTISLYIMSVFAWENEKVVISCAGTRLSDLPNVTLRRGCGNNPRRPKCFTISYRCCFSAETRIEFHLKRLQHRKLSLLHVTRLRIPAAESEN
jgi:hypothetical protein